MAKKYGVIISSSLNQTVPTKVADLFSQLKINHQLIPFDFSQINEALDRSQMDVRGKTLSPSEKNKIILTNENQYITVRLENRLPWTWTGKSQYPLVMLVHLAATMDNWDQNSLIT